MDAILTVRLEKSIKERGSELLRSKGLTPSGAVQRLFEYVVREGELPFEDETRPSPQEIESRLAVLQAFHTKEPLLLSDEDIRAARLRDRYELDAR
jgi:RHH-type rel operon transcriptional repressor/antitoxin RelB